MSPELGHCHGYICRNIDTHPTLWPIIDIISVKQTCIDCDTFLSNCLLEAIIYNVIGWLSEGDLYSLFIQGAENYGFKGYQT